MSWSSILANFDGHSLQDQASAALMDRVDTKYLVPHALLAQCVGGLSDHYTVLEAKGCRQMAYDTLYFDTPDRQHYRDHHNGKLNRLKVRIRHYCDSDDVFLEVKRKTNKGRTVKDRRWLGTRQPAPSELQKLMVDLLGLSATRMSPTLFVQYKRATLMSRDTCERVTVDTELAFLCADGGRREVLPELAILELKSGSLAPESPIARRLKALGYRPVAFSKYCVGTALLEPSRVKTNRFKPLLATLAGMISHPKEPSWNRQSIPTSLFA